MTYFFLSLLWIFTGNLIFEYHKHKYYLFFSSLYKLKPSWYYFFKALVMLAGPTSMWAYYSNRKRMDEVERELDNDQENN